MNAKQLITVGLLLLSEALILGFFGSDAIDSSVFRAVVGAAGAVLFACGMIMKAWS